MLEKVFVLGKQVQARSMVPYKTYMIMVVILILFYTFEINFSSDSGINMIENGSFSIHTFSGVRPWYNKTDYSFPKSMIIYQKLKHYNEAPRWKPMFFCPDEVWQSYSGNVLGQMDWSWNIHATYYIFNHTFVNGYGAMINNNTWVHFPYGQHFRMSDGIVLKRVEEAVYLGNAFIHMFAHVFIDIFGPFLILPMEIRKNVPLIVFGHVTTIMQVLDILGYDADNTILLKNRENFIEVDKMHTVIGNYQVNAFLGSVFRDLGILLRQKLGLGRAPARLYVLLNRPGKCRHFYNFDTVVDEVRLTFPDIKWEIWINYSENVRESARRWNSVKLIWGPTGSNFANAIFMQEKSCICVQFYDWWDSPVINEATAMNVSVVVTRAHNCGHYSFDKCNANITAAFDSLYKGMSLVNYSFKNIKERVMKLSEMKLFKL